MVRSSDSPIVILGSRTLAPVIQVFALYVIAHGHYSPGGGFQGGALLAASIILVRLSVGRRLGDLQFRRVMGTPMGVVGTLAFAAIGLVAMMGSGYFLQYTALPMGGIDPAMQRNLGILLVEFAVGLAVTGSVVAIYDDLTEPLHE